MPDDIKTLKSKIDQLSREFCTLSHKVDLICEHIEFSPDSSQMTPGTQAHAKEIAAEPESEWMLSWMGKSSILPRLSTVCFLLVVALILRTLTEKNLMSLQWGSLIGIMYSSILMLAGWYQYFRSSPLAPIFSVCGTFLMLSVVLETHARFDFLPLIPAYILLAFTGIGMSALSLKYRALAPASVAVVGSALAGSAIDFPHPFFPYLFTLLLTTSVSSQLLSNLKGRKWIRWVIILVTMLMALVWQLKLLGPETKESQIIFSLGREWFVSCVIVFAVWHLIMALIGMFHTAHGGTLSPFDRVLPTLNVIWTYAMLIRVPLSENSHLLIALAGLFTGAGHLWLVSELNKRKCLALQAHSSLFFAGSVLFALWLPLLSGYLFSLTALSLFAVGATLLSHRWNNRGILSTAYTLQIFVTVFLSVLLINVSSAPPVRSILVSVLLMGFGMTQYILRRQVPKQGKSFRALLLLTSLICAFHALNILAYHILFPLGVEIGNSLGSAQSLILNTSAMLLMLYSVFCKDREVRNVAIFVMVISALKVFTVDLLTLHGISRILSIFSCGIAISVCSLILGKWQQWIHSQNKNNSKPT